MRVIDTPNGGLSAARNVGLAEATGEIVAYTDADTRVDRDWLTFLVQPFLTSDVVGSGGPNVVPPDDPPMAQCIARAPGGPTHVLLDDRIAEHVPGCNMAFRRDALLAIGGFNPIYLRAGDDVDVCWRLQARGWKIGFASAALVWHHHRSSVKAYWRQQVGYGEGETWLMAHHPEKFLDGRMLWRGRIYSPLPFVRSLWGTRINAGVWGTAAFPSVYRTDVHPFAFLPHSIRWQVDLVRADARRPRRGRDRPAPLGVVPAARQPASIGLAATIAKNIAYALRSDVDSLPGSKLWYRATVAYLHFIQPLARIRGRIRGVLSPPEVALPSGEPQTSRGPRPSLAEAWRALLLISGNVTEDRFWSETWTSADRVLTQLTDWLRRSRAVRVDRDRRGLVRRSRRQRLRRPLGVARRARAGRGARRRQVAGARQHAPAADDVRRRHRARHRRRAAGRRDVGRRDPGRRDARHAAQLAARRHRRVVADRRADLGVALAHGADDGDRPARDRAGDARHRHGRDAVRPGARAAHRAVAAADVRPAQRRSSSS